MQHSIRLSLSLTGTAALALASIPYGAARADDTKVAQASGTAQDLGVMEVNLKDVVKFNYGFQGALQGAGTPNQAGLGAFIPLKVSKNSVSFVDVLVNANFSDYGNYSSIINAGYDSRPMATGPADTGVNVTNSQTVFYQQVAAGLEAVSNTWNFNAYALVPIGTTNAQLNSVYQAGSLDTYGLDVGYAITPDFKASLGYYYQNGDLGTADGSGLLTRLSYDLTNGLTLGVNYSYDQAFQSRVSGDIKYRFDSNGYGAPSKKNQLKKKAWQTPVIQALSEAAKHRDVRVHDCYARYNPTNYKVYGCGFI